MICSALPLNGLRYHASIPLYAHGKPLGVLNVASTDWKRLSHEDLRLLYTVSDLLSIAIERARLYARSADFGAAEERNRLAREIHDTLAQGLTAISLQLETADALMEAGSIQTQAHAAIKQALSLTRSNLEEARRSVLDLRAAPLEGRTLTDALCMLADTIGEKYNLHIDCDMVGGNRPLPTRIETGLFRIAQEALTNVARHARAKHASLQLITAPKEAHMIVEDDGQGFDPQNIPEGRFGLVGLNERVHLMGGKLELRSKQNGGTRISVRIPLEGQL